MPFASDGHAARLKALGVDYLAKIRAELDGQNALPDDERNREYRVLSIGVSIAMMAATDELGTMDIETGVNVCAHIGAIIFETAAPTAGVRLMDTLRTLIFRKTAELEADRLRPPS